MEVITLVTGGNQGMGLEIARELSAAGQHVIIGARDLKKGQAAVATLKTEGLFVETIQLDVTQADSIQQAVQTLTNRFGYLSRLINNAGAAFDDHIDPTELPTTTMRRDFDVNFFGLVDLTQALIPLLKKGAPARIINVSSMMGSHTAALDPNSEVYHASAVGYQASKSAANMFTIQLAKTLAAQNIHITVNAVDPGFVATNFGGTPAAISAARGAKSLPSGVHQTVHLATADSVPNATFTNTNGTVPW